MPRFQPQEIIASRTHPAITHIRRLQTRAERERTGRFYIEGLRFVAHAHQHRMGIEALVVCRQLLPQPWAHRLVHRIASEGTPVLEVTPEVLHSIALADDPQGIGAVVRQRWSHLEQIGPQAGLCWIALDTVHAPGNLGTMLRTSDAAGGAGLILLGEAVDPYDPATVRATMGALFSQCFVRTSTASFVRWKEQKRCLLVGTALTADTDYHAASYPPPVVLLMGDERKGLSPDLQAICDLLVRIPMVGQSDSLNLAVATSIMLYELFNQRRDGLR